MLTPAGEFVQRGGTSGGRRATECGTGSPEGLHYERHSSPKGLHYNGDGRHPEGLHCERYYDRYA